MYVRRDELEKQLQIRDLHNEAEGNLPFISDYLELKSKWIYRFPLASEEVDIENLVDKYRYIPTKI